MGDESEPAAMEEEKAESDIESDFEFDDEIKQSLDHLLKMPMECVETSEDEEEEEEHVHQPGRDPRLENVKLRSDSVERNLEALFVDDKERREVNRDYLSGKEKDTGLESISENEFDGPESGECDTSDGELPDSPNIVVTLPDSPPRLPSRESFIPGLDRVSADEESDVEVVEEFQTRSVEYYDVSHKAKDVLAKPEREVVIGSLYDEKTVKGKGKKEKEHKKDRSPEKKNKDKKGKKKTAGEKAEIKRKLKLKKYLARLDQYRAKCLEYMSQISEKCDIMKKDESRKIKLEKSRIKSMLPSEKLKSVVEKVKRRKETSPVGSSHSSHSSKFGKFSKEDISKLHIPIDKVKKSKVGKIKGSSSREEKEHKLKYHKYIQYLQAEREKCYEDSKVLDKHKHKSNQRKHDAKSSSPEKLKEKPLPFNRPPVMSFNEFCSSRELISPDRESPKRPLLKNNHDTNLKKERTTSIDSEATTVTMRSEPPPEEEKDLFVTYSELVKEDKKYQEELATEEESKEQENDLELKSISVFTSVLFKGATDPSGIPFFQEDKPPSPKVLEPVKPKTLFTPSNDLDELYDCNDELSSISQSSFSPSQSPVPKIHNKALLNFVENQKEQMENRNEKVPDKNKLKSIRSRSRSPRKEVPRTRKRKTKHHHSSLSISPSPPSLRPRSPESYKRKKSPLSQLKDRWRDYPSPTERRKEYYDASPRIYKRSRSRTRVRSGHRSRSSSEERYYRHYHSHSRSRSRSPVMVQISAAEKRRRLKEEHERALASLRATLRKPAPLSTPLSITFKTDGSSDNYDPVVMNEDSSSLSPGELTPAEMPVPALPPLPPGLPPEPPPVPTVDKSEDRTYTSFPNSNLVQTLNYVNNEMPPFNNWITSNIPQIGEVGSSIPHLYPASQVLNNYEQFNTPPPQPFPFLNQPPPPLPYQIQVPTPCHQHYRMSNQCPAQNINMINVHQEIKSVTHNPLVITQMPESTEYFQNNVLEASKCKHNLLGHNNQTVQEAIDSVKNCLKNCDGSKNKDPRLGSVENRSKSPEKLDNSNSLRGIRGQSDKVKITLNYRPRPVSTVKDVCVFDQETEAVETDSETGVRGENEHHSEKMFCFTSAADSRGNTEKSTFHSINSGRYKKTLSNLGAEPYDPFDSQDDDAEEIKSVEVLKKPVCLKDQAGIVRTSYPDTAAHLSNVEIDNINHHIGSSFAFIFSHTIERKRLTPTATAIAAKKKESKINKNHSCNLTISKTVGVKHNQNNTDVKNISQVLDVLVQNSYSGESCPQLTAGLCAKDGQPKIDCQISAVDSKHKTALPTIADEKTSVCPQSESTLVSTKDSQDKPNENYTSTEHNFDRKDILCTSFQNSYSDDIVELLESEVKISEEIVLKEIDLRSPINSKIINENNDKKSDSFDIPAESKGQNNYVNNDVKKVAKNKLRNGCIDLNIDENKLTTLSTSNGKPSIENKNRGLFERRGIPSLSIPTKGELKRFPTPERSFPTTSKEEAPKCAVSEQVDGDSSHINKIKCKEESDFPRPTNSVVDSIIDDFEDSNSTGSDSQDTRKTMNKHHREKLKTNSLTNSEEFKTSRFVKPNETSQPPEIINEESKTEPKTSVLNEECHRPQIQIAGQNEMLTNQRHSRKDAQAKADKALDLSRGTSSIVNKNASIENEQKIDEGILKRTKSLISSSNPEKFNNTTCDKTTKSCPLSKKHNSYISRNLPTSFDLTIDGHLIKKGFKKLQVKVKKIKAISDDSFTDQDESLPSSEDNNTPCFNSPKTDTSEQDVQLQVDGSNKKNFEDNENPKKFKKKVSFNMNVSEIMNSDPRPKDFNLTLNAKEQNMDTNHTDQTKDISEYENKQKESITTFHFKAAFQEKQNEITISKSLPDKTPSRSDDISLYYRNILKTLHIFHITPVELQHRKPIVLTIPKPEDMQEANIKETPKKSISIKNNKKTNSLTQTKDVVLNESYHGPKSDTEHENFEDNCPRKPTKDEDAINKEKTTKPSNSYQVISEKEVEKKKKQEKETETEDSSFLDRELSDLAKGCLDSDEESISNFGIAPSDESSVDSDFNSKCKNGTLRTSARQKSKILSAQNIKKRSLKKNTTIEHSKTINANLTKGIENQCFDQPSEQEGNILTSNKKSDQDKEEEKEIPQEVKIDSQLEDKPPKRGRPKRNVEISLKPPNNLPLAPGFEDKDQDKEEEKEIPQEVKIDSQLEDKPPKRGRQKRNVEISLKPPNNLPLVPEFEDKEKCQAEISDDRHTEIHHEIDCTSSVLLASQNIQNQAEDEIQKTVSPKKEKCDTSVQEILLSTEQVLKSQSDIVEKVTTEIENVKKDERHEKALDGTGILYGSLTENVEDSNTSTLRKVRILKTPKNKVSLQREETESESNPNISSTATELEKQQIQVDENIEDLNPIENKVDKFKNVENDIDERGYVQDQQSHDQTQHRRASKRKCVEKKLNENTISDTVFNSTNFENVMKRTRSKTKMKEDNFTFNSDVSKSQNNVVVLSEQSEGSNITRTSKLRNVRKGRKNYNESNLFKLSLEKELTFIQTKKCPEGGTALSKNKVQLNVEIMSSSCFDTVLSEDNLKCESIIKVNTSNTNSDISKSFKIPKGKNTNREKCGDLEKIVDETTSLLNVRQTRSSARFKYELNDGNDTKVPQDEVDKKDSFEDECIKSDSRLFSLQSSSDGLNSPKDEKIDKEIFCNETKNICSEGQKDVLEKKRSISEENVKIDESKLEIYFKCEKSVLDQGNQSKEIKGKVKTCVTGNTSENTNNVQELNSGGENDDHSKIKDTGDSKALNNASENSGDFARSNSSNSFESNTNEPSNPNLLNRSVTITPFPLIKRHFGPSTITEKIMSSVTPRNTSVNPKIKEALSRKKRDKAEVDAEIKRRLAEIDELEKLARTQHASLLGKIGAKTRSKVDLAHHEKSQEEEEDDIVSISSEDSNTTSVDTIDTRLSVTTVGEPSKTEDSTNDEPTTTLEEQVNKPQVVETSFKDNTHLLEIPKNSCKTTANQRIETNLENPLIPLNLTQQALTINNSTVNHSTPGQSVDFMTMNNSSTPQFYNDEDKMPSRKRMVLQSSESAVSENPIKLMNEPMKRARRNVASVYQFRDDDNNFENSQEVYKKFQSNRSVRNRPLPTLQRKKVNVSVNILRKTSSLNQNKSKSNLKYESSNNILPEPDSSTSSLPNLNSQPKNNVDHMQSSTSLKEKDKQEDHDVESFEAYLSNTSQNPISSKFTKSDIFRQPFKKSLISRKRRRRRPFYNKQVSASAKQLYSVDEGDRHNDTSEPVDEQSEEVVSSSVTNIPNEKLSQMKKRRKRKTCVDLLMEDSMLSVTRDFPMSPNPYMLSTIYKEMDSNTTSKTILKDISTEAAPPKKPLDNFDLIPKPDVLAQKLRLLEKLKCVNRKNRKTRQCRTLVCYNEDSLPESLVESPVSESAANHNENTSFSQDSGPNETTEKVEIISNVTSMDDMASVGEKPFRRNSKKTPRVVLKKSTHKDSPKRKFKGLQKRYLKNKYILPKHDSHVYDKVLDKVNSCEEELSAEADQSKEQLVSGGKVDEVTSLKPNESYRKDEPSEFDKLLQSSSTSHLRFSSQPISPRSQNDDKSNDASDDFFDSFPSPLHSDSDYDSAEEKFRSNEDINSTVPSTTKPTLSEYHSPTDHDPLIPRKIVCSILKSRIGQMLPYFEDTYSDDECDDDVPLSVKLLRSQNKPTANRENCNSPNFKDEIPNQLTTPDCSAKRRYKGREVGSRGKIVENKINMSNFFDDKEITNELIYTDSSKDEFYKTTTSRRKPTAIKNTRKAKSLKASYNENLQRSENVMYEGELSEEILPKKITNELYTNEFENNISLKRRGRPAKTKAALKEDVSAGAKIQMKSPGSIKGKLSKEVDENNDAFNDHNESMQLRKRRGRNLKPTTTTSLDDMLFSEQVGYSETQETHEKDLEYDHNEPETPCLDICPSDIGSKRRDNIRQRRFKPIKPDSQSAEIIHKNKMETDEQYEEVPLHKRILENLEENEVQENVLTIKSLQTKCVSPKLSKEKPENEKLHIYSDNMSDTEVKDTECAEEVSFDEPPPPLIKPRARRAKAKRLENVYLDPPSLTTFVMEVQINDKTYLDKSCIDPSLLKEDNTLPSRKRGRRTKELNLNLPETVSRHETNVDINEQEHSLEIILQPESTAEIPKQEDGTVNKNIFKKSCKKSKRKVPRKKVVKRNNIAKETIDGLNSEVESALPNLKSHNNTKDEILDPSVSSMDQPKSFSPNGDKNTKMVSKIDAEPTVQNITRKQKCKVQESPKESFDEQIPVIPKDTEQNFNEDENKTIENQNIDNESVTKESEIQEKPSTESEFKDTQSSSCGNQSLLWNKISEFLNKSTRSVGTQVKLKNMALKGFDISEPVVSLQSELTLPQVIKTLFEELKTLDSSFSDP